MKWFFSRFSVLEVSVLSRSVATPKSMRGAAWAKHPKPVVQAPLRGSCRVPQAGKL